MSMYEIKFQDYDYGIYKDGELKLVIGSRERALIIKFLLERDERENKRLSREGYQIERGVMSNG